jgi:ring-1,2-phenylacetyl-CoA epoxidase subunit PaaA
LGLTLPDEALAWNEAEGQYDYGEIDWDEFWAVVKGHGPLNKDRVAARKKAWDDGAWVREAAMAHAHKRVQRAATPMAAE